MGDLPLSAANPGQGPNETPEKASLDLPRSLNALFAYRVKQSGNDVFLCVPKSSPAAAAAAPASDFEYEQFTYGQVDRLIQHAAATYTELLPPKRRATPTQVVGLLASSGLEYVVSCFALYRLGHTVLHLSTNNSSAALVHLVQITSANCLFYSPDQSNTIADFKAEMQRQKVSPIPLYQCTSTADLAKAMPADRKPLTFYTSELSFDEEASEIAYIIHSSGSTGFPKPNYFSHRGSVEKFGNFVTGHTFLTTPFYHMYGHMTLWGTIRIGQRAYVYFERLSAGLLAKAIQASEAKLFCTVPFILKLLAESAEGIRALKKFELVYIGGSACPTEIGNRLVYKFDIPLVSAYGSTEAGGALASVRDFAKDKEWEYLRPLPGFKPYMKFENKGSDASGPFELVVGAGYPALSETNRPDGSYATKDLFIPHPSLPDAFKYVGRADDTLVHYNGEKTNPVPLELAIRASPHVAECLVVGAGRSQPGVLVAPSEAAITEAKAAVAASGIHQEDAVESKVKELIWTAVQVANTEAPSHSQIVPELVKVLPFGTKFIVADKGSLIRSRAEKAFEREIDELYQAYELGTFTKVPKVVLADVASSIDITAQVVSEVTGHPASSLKSALLKRDLTGLGLDSLKANRIRNQLQQRVQLAAGLPPNLVFEHPTIEELARCLLNYSQGNALNRIQKEQAETDATLALLKKLEDQVQARDAKVALNAPVSGKHTVVLTGSTGSLGAHILQQLAMLDTVKSIICLNRAENDDDAKRRTEKSLRARDLGSLDELVTLSGTDIVCFSAVLEDPKLGLQPEAWALVSSKVTCVIHNGWPVNFNMSVQSFAGPLLGSVALINMAAQTPATHKPRFIFASSVSATFGAPGARYEEDFSSDPNDTAKMGYARSKWIVERLCDYAQHHVGNGFEAAVARIGQMVGDRRSGIWNETEAMPLLIKSAQTVGCLPGLTEPVFWQPVDDAGFIIAHLVQPDRLNGVLHVVNPAPTPFSQILEYLAAPENLGDSFEVVPPSEWVRRLSESDQDPKRNPTIKLLDFYRESYGGERNAAADSASLSEKPWSTERLQQVFQDLGLEKDLEAMLVPVDAQLVRRIVAAWRRNGFLR